MQEYLLVAKPYPGPQANDSKLDVIHLRGGLLHPRWALVSCVLTNLASCAGYILWYFVPCPSGISFVSFFCAAYTWPSIIQILLIDLAFVLGWAFMFVFGYIPESPKEKRELRKYDRVRQFFHSISGTGRIRWLLSAYAGLLLLGVIAMCLLRPIQPVPFA